MEETQIVVAATLPPTPIVLADETWLRNLAFISERTKLMRVRTPEAAQQAAGMLQELTKLGTQLEASRKKVKQPFIDIGKAIDECARNPAMRIEGGKSIIKRELAEFDELERARIMAAERARLAEIARLEEEKRKQDEAAKIAATAVITMLGVPEGVAMDMEFDLEEPAPKSEIEKQIEAVKYAPAVKPAAPAGIAFKTRLLFTVTDLAALPDAYVLRTPNERLIRETYAAGYKDGDPLPVLPGVTFTVERMPVSTGRSAQQETF